MASSHFKKEEPLVRYANLAGRDRFMITADADRTWFFLYDITSDPPKRIGKERSPMLLEKKFKLNEVLREKPAQKSN